MKRPECSLEELEAVLEGVNEDRSVRPEILGKRYTQRHSVDHDYRWRDSGLLYHEDDESSLELF